MFHEKKIQRENHTIILYIGFVVSRPLKDFCKWNFTKQIKGFLKPPNQLMVYMLV